MATKNHTAPGANTRGITSTVHTPVEAKPEGFQEKVCILLTLVEANSESVEGKLRPAPSVPFHLLEESARLVAALGDRPSLAVAVAGISGHNFEEVPVLVGHPPATSKCGPVQIFIQPHQSNVTVP